MKFPVLTATGVGLAWINTAYSAPAPSSSQNAMPYGVQVPDTTGFQDPYIRLSKGGRAICVHGDIPVQTNVTKYQKLAFPVPANQSAATQALLTLTTVPAPAQQMTTNNSLPAIAGTHLIRGTLCMPLNTTAEKIQFLTHGLGFDRNYWDFSHGYSYVDVAAENNKATFYYDRLGVGQSQKADALNVVQGAFEVEIAHALAQALREGKFISKKFSSVVGVGHSFGSLLTQSITALYPSIFNATVLSGFSVNNTGVVPFISGLNLAIASENQPYRFAGLDPGYLVASSAISSQIAFFHLPGADPAIIAKVDDRKATITYGELLTQDSLLGYALQYTGAVAVVNGNQDLPFCFANCSAPIDQGTIALKKLYPNSKGAASYVAPNTGHGLNLHYSAGTTFQWIQDFITRAGQ